MPYSRAAKFTHHRRVHPDKLTKMYNVPISHTKARKKYPEGTRAIVGFNEKTGNWVIQSVLIPKRK